MCSLTADREQKVGWCLASLAKLWCDVGPLVHGKNLGDAGQKSFEEVWSILASLWEGAAKGMITSFIIHYWG